MRRDDLSGGDFKRRKQRCRAMSLVDPMQGATDGGVTISVSTHHQRIGDTDGSPNSKRRAARRS